MISQNTCTSLTSLHAVWHANPSKSSAKALGELVSTTLGPASADDTSAAGWESRLLALSMLGTKAAAAALSTETVLAALQRTMARVAVELERDARAAFSGRTLQVALGALRVWIVRSDAQQGQLRGAAAAALAVLASDPRHALRDAAQSALEGVLFNSAAAGTPPLCLAEDAVRLLRDHAAVQAQWLEARPRRVAGTVRTWVAALGAALGQRASRGAVNMLANALRPLLRNRDTALALDAHCAWVALVAGVCACGVEGSDARAAHLTALSAPLLKALNSSRVAVRRAAFYAWCAFAASAGASAAPPRAVAQLAVLPGLVRAAHDADEELRAAALDALAALVGRSLAADDVLEAALATAGERGEGAAVEGDAAAVERDAPVAGSSTAVGYTNRRLVRSLRTASAGESEGAVVDGRALLVAARSASLDALRGAVRSAARELLRANGDAALCASVDERIAARAAKGGSVLVAAGGSASSGLSALASSGSSSLSSPGASTLAPSVPPLSLSRGVRRLREAERGRRAFAAPSAGAASAAPVAPRLRAAPSRRAAGGGGGGSGAAAYVAIPKRVTETIIRRKKRRRVTANAALRYTTLESSQMPDGSEDFDYG